MMLVIDNMRQEAANVYRILHFLPKICSVEVVWAATPVFPLCSSKLVFVHSRNDVEISTDIPDRQNETHDSKTYGLNRHPYMANTDHSPRNSYIENNTCS